VRGRLAALSADWTRGELVAVTGAVALAILMFAFKWYGVAGVAGRTSTEPASQSSVNAWQALSVLRWLMLVTIALALGSFALHSTQRGHGSRTNTSPVLSAFGALTAALLIYRVLIALPNGSEVLDQKLGAVLGVFAAVAIAFGGFDALREERARARQANQRPRRASGVARDVPAR
jgi:formate hydrogenlyase subunit 3/multisubunit Na+/H+ antiporter MnhD subunit